MSKRKASRLMQDLEDQAEVDKLMKSHGVNIGLNPNPDTRLRSLAGTIGNRSLMETIGSIGGMAKRFMPIIPTVRPITAMAAEPTVRKARSAPVEVDISDHFRISSPNRRQADSRMAHHRNGG